MSTPQELFVYDNPDGSFFQVFLEKRAASDLFEYLYPKLVELDDNEISDRFVGEYCGDVMSITDVPTRYFPQVYDFIMQACDELESLKPYRDDLKQALESDPRYQAAQ